MDEKYAEQVKFHAKTFLERAKEMGDRAEEQYRICCNYYGLKTVRFGWDRPDLTRFGYLPLFLKYMPDYLTESNSEHYFTEVKSCGQDGVLKIKEDNLNALGFWNNLLPVRFFFHNSKSGSSLLGVSLETVKSVASKCETQIFNDNKKKYFLIPVSSFPDWVRLA